MGFDLTIRKRVSYLKDIRHRKILDAGCGDNGYISYYLWQHDNEVTGIDFRPSAVNSANLRANSRPNLKFRCMNLKDLGGLEEKFDVIVFMEVIEHLNDDVGVLKNLNKLLKPNGTLILSTINSECYLDRIYTQKISQSEDGGHVRLGYTREGLISKLKAAGFEPDRISSCIGRITQRALSIEYTLRNIAFSYNQIYRAAIFAFLYPISLLDNSKNEKDDMTLIVEARKRS